MRRPAALVLCLPALLASQPAPLDEGRIDPDWFGPGVVLRPSKALDFQWLRSGLALQGRTLPPPTWEPAAWLLGKRSPKDRSFLGRVEADLPARLEKGLRRGLKGRLPMAAGGDLRLLARVVDAEGLGDDYMAMGTCGLSFDVKLLDGATGEPLGAFHGNLRGPSVEAILLQFEGWCEHLGALLGTAVAPGPPPAPKASPAAPAPAAAPPVPAPGGRPPFDLEGALRRIEDLRRDGLLSEEEYQRLRKRAADRAK